MGYDAWHDGQSILSEFSTNGDPHVGQRSEGNRFCSEMIESFAGHFWGAVAFWGLSFTVVRSN